ncbi:MAG: alcohol dehydrogenase, partial [Phycisphaerales bacterium]
MKAAVITGEGTPVASNVAIVNDWQEVTPCANDVVVQTEASALNHLDLWVG